MYVAGPAALLLLALGAVAEGPAIMAGGGLAMAAADPLAFGAAFAMSALVNMTCFFAIQVPGRMGWGWGLPGGGGRGCGRKPAQCACAHVCVCVCWNACPLGPRGARMYGTHLCQWLGGLAGWRGRQRGPRAVSEGTCWQSKHLL